MEGVDPISQGLFFAATQSLSAQTASQANKQNKTTSAKRKNFTDAMNKAQEEQSLIEEGLPVELAEMDEEEAVVFLKDEADIAADKLRSNMTPTNFVEYRKKVSQFMRYIVSNNFSLNSHKRFGRNRKGQPLAPQIQIVVINKKLDEMAEWLLHDHKDTLKMLAKVDEISGLIVDLMAR